MLPSLKWDDTRHVLVEKDVFDMILSGNIWVLERSQADHAHGPLQPIRFGVPLQSTKCNCFPNAN